jgi:hypothetical protein
MPATKSKSVHTPEASTGNEYRGKRARTGNGFLFDRALFKNHPEFSGEVKAHLIAPGRMLVSVVKSGTKRRDPVMQSFLAFLAKDIANAPERIKPLSPELARRIDLLVEEVDRDGRREKALRLRGILKRDEAAELRKTAAALRTNWRHAK